MLTSGARRGGRAERLWLGAILLLTGLAHGINLFRFPFFHDDEGIYISQAWAVLTEGRLAPYTYWYDHAPLGWLQLAAWGLLSGGLFTCGSAVESGRVLMLLVQLGC